VALAAYLLMRLVEVSIGHETSIEITSLSPKRDAT
jgi:hypothetical protein